jgi:hypothetical protein
MQRLASIYFNVPALRPGTVGAYVFAFLCAGAAATLRLAMILISWAFSSLRSFPRSLSRPDQRVRGGPFLRRAQRQRSHILRTAPALVVLHRPPGGNSGSPGVCPGDTFQCDPRCWVALCRRTLQRAPGKGAPLHGRGRSSCQDRVWALSANQDLLIRNDWHGIETEDLVCAQLASLRRSHWLPYRGAWLPVAFECSLGASHRARASRTYR